MRVALDRYAFEASSPAGGACVLGVRPESVATGADAAARPFSCEIEIEIVEPMGANTLVWTKLAGSNFAFLIDSESRLKPGERVTIGFDPARASLFDGATDARL